MRRIPQFSLSLLIALPACGPADNPDPPSQTSPPATTAVETPAPGDTAHTSEDTPTPIPSLETEVLVIKASQPPIPETAPYKDCFIHFTAQQLVDDDGQPLADGPVYNLVTFGFQGRKWKDGGRLMPGCRLRVKATDFFAAPAETQSVHRVDDTGDFDSPILLVTDLVVREGFLRALPEMPEEEESSRQVAMIQRILASYHDGVVGGVRDGWFFELKNTGHYQPDFWKGFSHSNPRIEGSFEAIKTFSQQLKERGIELHVVLSPRSASIYPEYATNVRYDPEIHGRVNPEVGKMAEALRQAGVSTIDLTPAFLEKRWQPFPLDGKEYPLFLPNDHHWSPLGVRLAAEEITRHLVDTGNLELPEKPLHFDEVEQVLPFAGTPYNSWISPQVPDTPQVFDTAYLTLVPKDKEAESALKPDQESPIHLIGDSFTWCHKTGNNLRSQLVHLLRTPIGATGVAAGDQTQARQTFARSPSLEHAKHLIWVIGENGLGEHEKWQRVDFGETASLDLAQPALYQPQPKKIGFPGGRTIRFAPGGQAPATTKTYQLELPSVTISSESFFTTTVQYEPFTEGQWETTSDVRFRLLIDGDEVATHHEERENFRSPRFWRIDLSPQAGTKRSVTIEVTVETRENPLEARPCLKEPEIQTATLSD